MIHRSAVKCLLFVLCVLVAGHAHAQTGQMLDEYGASPKSIAMGQAFTAMANDFSAAYYNPAGLTQIKGIVEMSLGIFYAKQNATADIASVPYRYDNDMPSEITGQRTNKGFIIGIASSLDVESLITAYPLFKRFAFGMVFWLNYPEMLTYDSGPEDYRPHFFRYDQGFALLAMVASAAVEITPWLSFGGGVFMNQNSFSRQEVFSAVNHSGYVPLPGWVAPLQAASGLSSSQDVPRCLLAGTKQVPPWQGAPDCQPRYRGSRRGAVGYRVERFRKYVYLQHCGVSAATAHGRPGRRADQRAFPGRGRDLEGVLRIRD